MHAIFKCYNYYFIDLLIHQIFLAKLSDYFSIPYSAKCWRWKTLVNFTENYIGKKTLANSNKKQHTLAICIADVELPSILYA